MIQILEPTAELLENYHQDFYALLNSLSKAPLVDISSTLETFERIMNQWSVLFVAIDQEKKRLVGTITLLLEQKFYRWWVKAWHIEDVIVHSDYQWQWIWRQLLEKAIQRAKSEQCYKIILDCEEELSRYYQKFGFTEDGVFMRKYL